MAIHLRTRVWCVVVVCCLLGVPVFVGAMSARQRAASVNRLLKKVPHQSSDDGFVSSSTCQACHPAAYDSWHDSYHRTMTQYASPESVVGDFNNVAFEYFDISFRLQRRGEEFWVQLNDEWRRVVQTTGSHHYQMYWLESAHGNRLENLPFAYLIKEQKWVRRNDVFMVPPEVASQPEGVRIWNNTCVDCHSTHGQPKMDTENMAAETRVAEVGIACEACHGPAHEHVQYHANPLHRYQARLFGASPSGGMTNPMKLPSKRSAEVCGQCHSIFGVTDGDERNRKGLLYRAGDELDETRSVLRHPARKELPHNQGLTRDFLDKYFWSDGMVRVSGREFNGLIESACYQRGEMSCLSCHSMHSSDPNDQLKRNMVGDEACLQCHQDMKGDLSAHTHHESESSGSRCYNCHMPHTTYGLVKAIRSHEIDTPSVQATVSTGRPNACNLCHLDKSLGWTQQHLADWYGARAVSLNAEQQNVSAAVQWLLSGDAGQRAIVAWHGGWEPARTASGDQWIAPFLAELLDDDYPVVRCIAGRALESLPGTDDIDYDFTAEQEDRKRVMKTVVDRWNARSKSELSGYGREVLLDGQGNINYGKLFGLRNQRNHRPVDLLE
jgi:predicted CXXCH cytochrome family protein